MAAQYQKSSTPLTLCDVPLCNDLTSEQIDSFQKSFETEAVDQKVDLIRAGSCNTRVFIVCSGSVKIVYGSSAGNQKIINILGHGEILGEMSVIDEVPASATVTTLEPCDLLRIEGESFRQALLQFPRMSLNLLTAQSQRIRLLTQRVETFMASSVRCRIAHQLLLFAHNYGIPARDEENEPSEDIYLPLRLKQRDLAELVGASREQVNRALSAFQTEGCISIGHNHRFTLHDTDCLMRFCS